MNPYAITRLRPGSGFLFMTRHVAKPAPGTYLIQQGQRILCWVEGGCCSQFDSGLQNNNRKRTESTHVPCTRVAAARKGIQPIASSQAKMNRDEVRPRP